MAAQPFAGVLVPVLTPFTATGEPDIGRFIAFCRFLLDQGADGLAIFGTTSEANSMAAGERMALLDRLIASGVPAAKLMPGTGACSIIEAATLEREFPLEVRQSVITEPRVLSVVKHEVEEPDGTVVHQSVAAV